MLPEPGNDEIAVIDRPSSGLKNLGGSAHSDEMFLLGLKSFCQIDNKSVVYTVHPIWQGLYIRITMPKSFSLYSIVSFQWLQIIFEW